MVSPFVRTALAVLLVSSFVWALSAEDVARFYLKSGESMKLEPITVSGVTYDLVKIDGEPALVLAPSGNTFEPVSDQSALLPIIQAYSQNVFKAKDFKSSVSLLNETEPLVETVVGNCVAGAQQFIKVIPTRTIRVGKANIGLFYLIRSSPTYASEQNAIASLNQSLPSFVDAYNAFLPGATQFASLVAAGGPDAILSGARTLHDSAVTLKAQYANVSASYAQLGASKDFNAILLYTFYINGDLHNCSLNGNATTALSRIENEFSDRALKSSSELQDSILAFTAARNSSGRKDTAYAIRREEIAGTESAVANLSLQFNVAGYKSDLKALVAKKDSLKAALLSVNSTGQTASFDAALKDLSAQLAQYAAAVPAFKSAALGVKAASDNVSAAQKKYGEADTRVQSLVSQLNALKTNMSSSVNLLSSGDAPKASAQFAAVSTQASDLGQRAGTLPAQGNQLDLPVILGIVALVAVLGGTVWYFRKMKQSKPKMGA